MENNGTSITITSKAIKNETLAALNPGLSEVDRRVAIAVNLLNQWKDHHNPVNEVADHLRISNSHLRQLFRKNIRISPGKYLKLMRLQSAKVLINDTFLSIKEVVGQVGYGDVSHFVRDFKTQYGMTPSQVRKQPVKTANSKMAAVPPKNMRFG